MAARKRASTRSRPDLLKQAVSAGRSAIREAERRVPPDLRKQIERSIKDGQKTVHSAIKDVQSRLDRTARQADVDKVLARLEGLSKQVQQLARSAATRAAARPAPVKTAARRAAKRKPAARKPAARKPASKKAAPRKTAAAARPARRRPSPKRPAADRQAAITAPVVRTVPPPPAADDPGPLPERVETSENLA
jgi:polyhydroxyalkanoate synthesis regulator phasin